jgi:hypothetical protein
MFLQEYSITVRQGENVPVGSNAHGTANRSKKRPSSGGEDAPLK